jgi:DNA-binding response OmpR family regulator/phosphoribosyl 1,2-cyclic phosphodiesterase
MNENSENIDIIVIDDDPMTGELTKDILKDEGWNILLIDDSMKAIEGIKKYRPKLVIADIMMPGINGMEICKRIKSEPEIKTTRVIILSGKSYETEKQKAINLGADYFIPKPYEPAKLIEIVKTILGSTTKVPPPPTPKIKTEEPTLKVNLNQELDIESIKVTAYGIRGLGEKLPFQPSRFGRQTLSFSIETKKDILILDAGTGIVELGEKIIKEQFYVNIWIFITHFHLDNTIGLGNFNPLFDANYTVNIVGPNDPEKSLREFIKSSLYSSFSAKGIPPKAKINIYEVLEENYEISDDIKMATMYANHPTTTIIYLFNINGFKIAYAPDSEIWEEATAFQDYNERLQRFTQGFDLLIHDSYYNDEDYKTMHHHGHSGISAISSFATKSKIKTFIPVNINPTYTDEQIEDMMAKANKLLEGTQTKMLILKENEFQIFKKGG